MDISHMDSIMNKYTKDQSSLIILLQEVEKEYGYLPREVLEHISNTNNIPLSEIYGVATFYEFFSLEPKGKHVIKICDGTSCHVNKSNALINEVKNMLGLSDEEDTTKDGLITIEIVSCLGGCAVSPSMMMDDKLYPKMNIEKIKDIINGLS